jgi:hypothetical protein
MEVVPISVYYLQLFSHKNIIKKILLKKDGRINGKPVKASLSSHLTVTYE